MKYLKRFIIWLVYLLPAALYCSYYPIIKIGETSSMNLEFSLPLIWLIVFDITSFIALVLFKKRPEVPSKTSKGEHYALLRISTTNRARTKRRLTRNDESRQACPKKQSARLFNDFGGISDRRFFLFSLFPFFATLSIFWSANPTRAILTAGIIWLLFFAIFALIYILPLLKLPINFQRNCLRSFFIASCIICFICWIQCILDIAGLSRETTLMCHGCTYHSFGFPHPSGLAIEPQFMGNLLLAPTLTSFYLLIFSKKAKEKINAKGRRSKIGDESVGNGARPKQGLLYTLTACLFSATLFLTFSRGAIYAYGIALVIMLVFALRRHVFRPSLILIPLATFIFTVGAQGVFTVVGPTHGDFIDGVSRSVNQLSLGIIDFRSHISTSPEHIPTTNQPEESTDNQAVFTDKKTSQETSAASNLTTNNTTDPVSPATQPAFDGYVTESTNIRLNLNQAALDTWLSAPGHAESGLDIGLRCHFFLSGTGPACTASAPLTPTSVLFGVGLGGAGTAMYRNSSITNITSPKEIVQNQGISLLLELGLVGVFLVLFSLLIVFFPQIFLRKFLDGKTAGAGKASPSTFWNQPALPLFISLIIAYLVTLNFFSGLPNALQIYLMPPLLYFIFQPSSASDKDSSRHPSKPNKMPKNKTKTKKSPRKSQKTLALNYYE